MKKKIHINLKLIVIILLLIIGAYYLIKGSNDIADCDEAVSFEELKASDIKDGVYVCGYIEKFVIRTGMVNGIEVKDAVSQTVVEFTGDRDIYTLPFENNKYIQLMARSKEAKENLNNMLDHPNEKAYFEGVIVKRNIGINWSWFSIVDKDDYPGINDIISEYYIREVDRNDFWNDIRLGAILAVIAVLLFVDSSGFSGLIEKEEIKPEARNIRNLSDIDNKEDELIDKEYILRQLTRKQKRIKKKKPSSIVMMVLGVLCIIILPKIFFIGIILLIFGGKGFFEWFINSSNINGIKLAKKLGVDSLYVMIEQCKRDIKELEELVYNEERDNM